MLMRQEMQTKQEIDKRINPKLLPQEVKGYKKSI